MLTAVPTGPLVGAKEARVGAATTVKLAPLVAVPPGVTTWIDPLVAPAGTVVVIVVSFTTVNAGWLVPLKRTTLAPVKPAPVMLTAVPTGPLVGAKEARVGAAITVKLVPLVAVPPGVTTSIGPLAAPAGTVVVIVVSFTTVNAGCGVPLKRTALAPVKPLPVSVTAVPTGPLAGLNVVRVGAAITVKLAPLVAVPPAVTTSIGPVVAPLGTVVVIVVSFTTVNAGWLVPLKRTALAPVKPLPVSVTAVPTGPLVGAKALNVGAGVPPTGAFMSA
jgi:hypothetical protein